MVDKGNIFKSRNGKAHLCYSSDSFLRAGNAEEERIQVLNCLGYFCLFALLVCLLTLEIAEYLVWSLTTKKGENNKGHNVAFTFASSSPTDVTYVP